MTQPTSIVISVVHTIRDSVDFMAWNTTLALVPLVVALWVYARQRDAAIGVSLLCAILIWFRRQSIVHGLLLLWQGMSTTHLTYILVGAAVFASLLLIPRLRQPLVYAASTAVFVAFLPNAPYVLTDILHFFELVRTISSPTVIVLSAIPLYLSFMTLGFGSYVASLSLFSADLKRRLPWLSTTAFELSVHAVIAFGVYLGRVVRLNSWDIITDPQAVINQSLQALVLRDALLFVGLAFIGISVLFIAMRTLGRALWAYEQRVLQLRRRLPAFLLRGRV